jgi:hypothetical protein
LDNYRLRIDGLSGTNLILWQELVNTASNGIKTVWLQKDGINIHSALDVSTNILYPVLSNLHPHLLVWHMKELADFDDMFGTNDAEVALSNDLERLERWWSAAMPDGDVVYIGTPYEARDLNGPYSERQNRIVRNAALRHGRCYVDSMTPMISCLWMASQGYLDNEVHPSNACYTNMADIVWRELGFFALRLDRQLAFQPVPAGLQLEWATRTNVGCELQCSTSLATWETIHTNQGDGARYAFTNAVSSDPARFYRLRWTWE